MNALPQDSLWAKRDGPDRWHSLVGHSADVSAALRALLELPLIDTRLRHLGRVEETNAKVITAKLSALAFLHDIGKANRGFQARSNACAPPVGHIDELAWVFSGRRGADAVYDRLAEMIGLDRVKAWLPSRDLFHAVFAHHGRPWNADGDGWQGDIKDHSAHWRNGPGDPVTTLAPMRAAFDAWFGDALADERPLPDQAAFEHAFAGLLMLADWLGSNSAPDFFPFDHGDHANRMTFAQRRMATVLPATGLDMRPARESAGRGGAGFSEAFAQSGRPPFIARPIQAETACHPAPLLVLEAETGSGKTEAALWRFVELFRNGAVDGLYFALPTRVAATQIFERVKRFRDNVFLPHERPAVVLAVPGQLRVDDGEGVRLPDFDVQWSDDGDRAARWAAEHPKRFLAAPIAVGTIDQVLLGSVRVKHAHLRAASLLNKFLVVDEVHASDAYMERLLTNLLRFHVGAGGHALLLSATLGAGARSRLLGATTIPGRAEADAAPYPALRWCEGGLERCHPLDSIGEPKVVHMEARAILSEPEAIADAAIAAARAGAKVLIVRNTVGQALRVQEALEARVTTADDATLFQVPHENGRPIATLHHSRFAEPDRRLLDAAVEAAIGRERPAGGRIVIGTQTLEQSLDLDADLLFTDLCPVDVMLQRIGRLHRHAGRLRPRDVAEPRAIVLVPDSRDLFRKDLRAYGLGAGETGGVYEDLRILELTRRLIEAEPVWTIPAMNRRLVEAATHPEALAGIEAELASGDPGWRPHFDRLTGRYFADLSTAEGALLRFDRPFSTFRVEADEIIATRLGGADRHVDFKSDEHPLPIGPFGRPIVSLKLPHHMARDVPADAQPYIVEHFCEQNGFTFHLGPAVFTYDRLGLRRVNGRQEP